MAEQRKLIQSAKDGDVYLVETVLNQGCGVGKVNCVDGEGNSALQWAASSGHISLLQLLITSGADINSTNDVGWSPLMTAARAGHFHAVRLLLQHGAQASHTNYIGTSVKAMAAASENNQLIEYLEKYSKPSYEGEEFGYIQPHVQHKPVQQVTLQQMQQSVEHMQQMKQQHQNMQQQNVPQINIQHSEENMNMSYCDMQQKQPSYKEKRPENINLARMDVPYCGMTPVAEQTAFATVTSPFQQTYANNNATAFNGFFHHTPQQLQHSPILHSPADPHSYLMNPFSLPMMVSPMASTPVYLCPSPSPMSISPTTPTYLTPHTPTHLTPHTPMPSPTHSFPLTPTDFNISPHFQVQSPQYMVM